MLVKVQDKKWVQDPGVAELIEHFDAKEREFLSRKNPKGMTIMDTLNKREIDVIAAEIEKCRTDFSYASRNYFWIINRNTRHDNLLRLREPQELIVYHMNRLKERGRPQKLLIIKARQLGCSTVAEGLMAHKAIFFRNTEGLIITQSDTHASYLFSIVQHIYNRLPWWLKPARSNLQYRSELFLENPNPDDRRRNPGMNSRITASSAESRIGVGQGRSLVAFHGSEFCSWAEDKAREIIEEDVENALADGPNTFAILESTSNGAGTYSHDFWLRMEKMEDRAGWLPVFLPWFFDRSHVIYDIPAGWKPEQAELDMRERAMADWVRCDNGQCEMFHRRSINTKQYVGANCPYCKTGILRDFVLSDAQCYWMENRRKNVEDDDESLSKLRQEQCSTPEESFRTSGIRLFSEKAIAYANKTVRTPIAKGYIDKSLRFHGVNPETGACWFAGCDQDHQYDPDALLIWEFPEPGQEYIVGVDTADGLGGKYDYLVAQVIRKNRYGGADVQVACFALNIINPVDFATAVNRIGHYYNQALVAPEVNAQSGGTVLTMLRVVLNYPHIYQPINPMTLKMDTTTIGWRTTPGTKPNLYNALRTGLESRLIEIRDSLTVQEINNFRREDSTSRKMGAVVGHDDRIMALMIAYFVAHESDWDPDSGLLRARVQLTLENAPVIYTCLACGHAWPARTPGEYNKCEKCRCMHIMVDTRGPSISAMETPESPKPVYNPWEETSEDESFANCPDYYSL